MPSAKTPRGEKQSPGTPRKQNKQQKERPEQLASPVVEQSSPVRNSSMSSTGSFGSSPRSPGSPSAGEPEKKKSSGEFINRVVFTLIMAYGFLGLVSQGANVLLPTVLLIQIMMFKEVLRINQKERKYRQMPYFKLLPWYFLTVTVVVATSYHLRDVFLTTWGTAFPQIRVFYQSFGLVTFGLYVLGFVAFVMSLKKGLYRYQIGQFTWIAMTLLFIMGQGSLQAANLIRGVYWFLLPISCVVHNDIWAYAWGKSFGRTRLLKLSPKKTVEGFVGAWLFTTIWAFWFSGFMCNFPEMYCPKKDIFSPLSCVKEDLFVSAPYKYPEWFVALIASTGLKAANVLPTLMIAPVQWHSIAFAAFVSLIAPFGGFFASGLKRAFKLKDFGDLIPGHGGMTDRMDCQIITGMFTYIYTASFIYAEAKCPSMIQLLNCALQMPKEQQLALAKELMQQ